MKTSTDSRLPGASAYLNPLGCLSGSATKAAALNVEARNVSNSTISSPLWKAAAPQSATSNYFAKPAIARRGEESREPCWPGAEVCHPTDPLHDKRRLVRFLTLRSGLPLHYNHSLILNFGVSAAQQCPCVPQQCPNALPFSSRRPRVSPVLRDGPPDSLDTFSGLRPCAESAMKPATSIRHRWALARRAASRLCTASRRLGKIPRRIPVFEPAAPRFMGCSFGFFHLPPPPGRCWCCSARPQPPAHLDTRGRALR